MCAARGKRQFYVIARSSGPVIGRIDGGSAQRMLGTVVENANGGGSG
jgi:hypothetical protein